MRSKIQLGCAVALLMLSACAEDERPRTTIVAQSDPDKEVVFLTDDVIGLKHMQAENAPSKPKAEPQENTLSQLQKAALTGGPSAQLRYAQALMDKEEPYSDKIAYYWISQAAQSQDPEAIFMLAYCYYAGIGTPVSYKQSRSYFYPLAEANIPQAQYYLAKIYFEGTDGTRNLPLARKWITKAMAANLTEAKKLAQQIFKEYDEVDRDNDDDDNALIQVVEDNGVRDYPHAIDASELFESPEMTDRI